MPLPPDPPMNWYGLSKVHSRSGDPLAGLRYDTSDQSSASIAFLSSVGSRAVVIGLASHPYAASARARSSALRLDAASERPRSSNARRRSPVVWRLTASMSAGSVASASAAIDRSTSG